ncbi:MAG: pyrroline-5-carboxylate reductase [Pseudomonadota bacterium]
MNITFIGGGNMASAMIGGLLKRGFSAAQLRAVEIDATNRKQLAAKYGIAMFAELKGAVEGSELVVLAVKPQQMRDAAVQLGPLLCGQIVLSIAAGIRLADLQRWVGGTGIFVRAMPNTPALIGAGITGLASTPPKHLLPLQQIEYIEKTISSMGALVWLDDETEMDAVTAVSGSGPAYFFYFIEALEQAGVALGLAPQTARRLALETALGAARLAHDSPDDPATLRTRVTSKNGTTERALLSLEANGVKQHIITAVQAAAARAAEMGDELGKG